MSTFRTNKHYKASATFIPYAVGRLRESFSAEGFSVSEKSFSLTRTVISVTKGNLLARAVGLKRELEIAIDRDGVDISVDIKAPVLKNDVAPAALSLLLSAPIILLPAGIGIVRQPGLVGRAVEVLDSAFGSFVLEQPSFCPACGGGIYGNPARCPHCDHIL